MTFYDNGTAIGSGTLALVSGSDEATLTTSACLEARTRSPQPTPAATPTSFPALLARRQPGGEPRRHGDGTRVSIAKSFSLRPSGDFHGDCNRCRTGSGTPTGTLTFYGNGTAIGTGTLSVVDGFDEATFTTSALAVGTEAITAAYTSGDANFAPSAASAAVSQVVAQDGATATVTSSAIPPLTASR